MILFLDFDGVLHPASCDDEGLFSCKPLLEDVLRAFTGVQIVISSSWRENHPMEELRGYFASDLRARIIGATPLHYPASKLPKDLKGYARHCECITWMRRRRPSRTPWLAIDDQAWRFHPSCETLLVTDGGTGFTTKDEDALRRRLQVATQTCGPTTQRGRAAGAALCRGGLTEDE